MAAWYLSLLHNIQTSTRAHSASHWMCTRHSIAGGKAATAWSWSLFSISSYTPLWSRQEHFSLYPNPFTDNLQAEIYTVSVQHCKQLWHVSLFLQWIRQIFPSCVSVSHISCNHMHFINKLTGYFALACIHQLTNQSTNYREQNSSWEANSSSLSKRITHIPWHRTVRDQLHNSPPFVPILSQINPVHTLSFSSWRKFFIVQPYLCLVLPSHLLLSSFPTRTLHAFLSLLLHATCPAYLIFIQCISIIIFSERYKSQSTSLCNFLQSPLTSTLSGQNISLKHPILKHSQPVFFP